jgi:hypothetical protein
MKRPTFFFVLLFSLLAELLQAQVDTPKVGFARYADKSVRAIFGIHADFVVERQERGSADALSFSDSGGLIARNGMIQLRNSDYSLVAEYNSGEAAPLVNVDGDPTTAIAWLPDRRALLHWNGKTFDLVETNANGLFSRVTSVWVQNARTAKLLISEQGGAVSEATVSLVTGDIIALQLLGGVQAPAFHHQSFVLFPDKHGLVVASGASIRTIPLTAGILAIKDLAIERVSSDWLHISSAGIPQNWILHLTGGVLEISELPALLSGTQQEADK